MEFSDSSVIIDGRLDWMMEPELASYFTHAFCTCGKCEVTFNGQVFTMSEGDCMIIVANRLVSRIVPSKDFKVTAIYVEESFLRASTPHSNYGTRGGLSLYINPIMKLTEEERVICRRGFENVCYRMEHPHRFFHADEMMTALQQLFIDFYECHSRIEGEAEISSQAALVMRNFVELLEKGDYKQNREVSYYADKLNVTPKYLSEVCKKVSGFSANSWINRYASIELVHLLKDRSLSLTEISDIFNFSSQSHFSRFVQNNLGQKPSAFRL
ncbi:MAG: AraC family transcriptional regulator [Bacteroidales bacterium]|nr:AraC family transcriptional regulator [Bacteroidales bacterium]